MGDLSDRILLRPPKQERSKQLIEAICDAALAVARTSGLRAVNTNAIAAKADVPPTSIYRFFSDKSAIVEYIHARWMEDVQAVWQGMESDQETLKLTWQQFFLLESQAWKLPSKTDYYAILNHSEALFPRLEALERAHRNYFADFFVRQMARFGARGTIEEWRDLAFFLYAIDQELCSPITSESFRSQESAKNFYNKTLLFHVGELMRSE